MIDKNWCPPPPLRGAVHEYNRKGIILDAHLGGKIEHHTAIMWAKECKAVEVLDYLENRICMSHLCFPKKGGVDAS